MQEKYFFPTNGGLLKLRLPSNAVFERVHDVAGDMHCQFNLYEPYVLYIYI